MWLDSLFMKRIMIILILRCKYLLFPFLIFAICGAKSSFSRQNSNNRNEIGFICFKKFASNKLNSCYGHENVAKDKNMSNLSLKNNIIHLIWAYLLRDMNWMVLSITFVTSDYGYLSSRKKLFVFFMFSQKK